MTFSTPLSVTVLFSVLLSLGAPPVNADDFDCAAYDSNHGDLASPGDLTAASYGPNVAEIFWAPDQYDPDLLTTAEIWLDDEPIDTVFANGSYVYRSQTNRALAGRLARIRIIDRCGRISPFSAGVSLPNVTVTDQPVPVTGEFDCEIYPLPSPGSLSVARYNLGRAEIFWVADQYHPDLLTQAEVWIDGEYFDMRFANGSYDFRSNGTAFQDIWQNRTVQIRMLDRCDRTSAFSSPLTIPSYAETLEDDWAPPVAETINDISQPETPSADNESICEAFGELASPGDLTATRYSEGAAEIFWQADQYHPDLLTRVIVQLNEQPVETVFRNGSYQFFGYEDAGLDNATATIVIIDRCDRTSPPSSSVTIQPFN